MFKGQGRISVLFIIGISIMLAMAAGRSYADGIVAFGPQDANIEGAIKYSVIGQYRAHFNNFKGRIFLDERSRQIRSVYLEIESGSIRSNHPWCDKLARSRRLLNSARYPKIIFRSDKIVHDESGYKVKGVLEMHGIKRKMIFPFTSKVHIDPYTRRKIVDLKGSWNIDRKDFNIIWNKYLDQGGIVVSDIFTVNWTVYISLLNGNK
jgi:polyisoprenoid-binding protein YceI